MNQYYIITLILEQRAYGRLLDIRDNYPKYVLRTNAFTGGNFDTMSQYL